MDIKDKKTKVFFTTYINEEPNQLVRLVQLFTGSRTIGKDKISVLVFDSRSPDYYPLIHTCSQQVDLPKYPDYNTFKKKLEGSFTSMKTFDVL